METKLQEIRNQQKSSWNKFSPEWQKWDDLLMTSLSPLKDEIIRLLKLEDDDIVLDIASGTGAPGLDIAEKLENGKVFITDLSENMLAFAQENADERNIKNIETKVCDACELPFPDKTFDGISCRLGFMFVPDLQMAAKEMYRVLKDGGRIALSVWDVPEKNFWATAIGTSISKNLNIPPPSPETPGLFRCSKNGMVQDLLQKAGFEETAEKEVDVTLNFGNAETYWNMTTDVTAPLALALEKADPELKEKIKNEVYQKINQKYPDGNVKMGGSTLLIYGQK